MNRKSKFDIFNIFISLVIIGAFLVAVMIAMLSELGVHPDEWDVKMCLDWGMKHWIWPDMRAADVADTYSWYGYTKVCNFTPYFLIAGKVAYFVAAVMKTLPYFRVPNLLLALFLTVFMLRKVKEHKYLAFAYCMTVQIWYIFCYVTADALDFVWAFLALYLLAYEDSFLWKLIKNDDEKISKPRRIVYILVLGILYGCMLLGKPYYYEILALTFFVLMRYLFKAPSEKRKEIFVKYLLILGIAGLIFAGRYGLEVHYYGSERAEIKIQMAEQYSSYDKKPSTPVEEQTVTYHMAEKGYSLADLFRYDRKWFAKSYRSLVSARITTEGDTWYYVLMGALLLTLLGWVGYELYKTDKYTLVLSILLMIGGVFASVMNSYLIDSQAQGRYLLPLALIFAYMVSRVPSLWEKKGFKVLVMAAAGFSIIYFGLFDSRKLIDLGYVRTLFG